MVRAPAPSGLSSVWKEPGSTRSVGNPPYVRQEALKEDKEWYQQAFPNTYDAANDLYVYFMEREIEHVRANGLVGLIVADKWLRSDTAESSGDTSCRWRNRSALWTSAIRRSFPTRTLFHACQFSGARQAEQQPMMTPRSNDTALACRFPREDYDPHQPIGPYIAREG